MATYVSNFYVDNHPIISSKSRRKFTPQEDENLKCLISQFGSNNWIKIANLMPGRNAKQCRDRFCNYLSVFHKKDPWEPEEDEILLNLLSIIGSKWVEISKYIPGRSGNDVKNRWYKHLSKTHPGYKKSLIFKSKNESSEKCSSPIEETTISSPENIEQPWKQYSISALLI